MSLQIRRGTDAQRQQVVFDLGEIVYTTDTKKLYIGDGVSGVGTAGGVNVLASSAGTGLSWNATTQTLNFSGTLSGYTTDNLAQGTVNLYYTPTRAKADIANMFTATGSSRVTGTVTATTATTISFVGAVSTVNGTGVLTYTSGTVPQVGMIISGTGINASPATYIVSGTSPTFILNQVPTAAGAGVAIQGVISLVSVGSATGLVALEPFTVTGTGGGGLSAATYYIINPTAGSNQISLATSLANAQTGVAITNLTTATLVATTFTAGGPDANITFSYNPVTGTMSVNSAASGITSVVQDTAPRLGGDLVLNSKNITGTGTINITGSITGTTITGTSLVGPLTVGTLSVSSNLLSVASGILNIQNNTQNMMQIKGVNTDGNITHTPQINVVSSRGTVSVPTNSSPGDYVAVINFGGYYNAGYQQIASIISQYDPTATMANSNPASNFGIATNNNNGGTNFATFDYRGVFSAPVYQAGSFTTTTMNAIPSPAAGMIIFNSTVNHFYGYNGTAWVAFTGP